MHRFFCKGWDSVLAFYLALTCSSMITNFEHQKEERLLWLFEQELHPGRPAVDSIAQSDIVGQVYQG